MDEWDCDNRAVPYSMDILFVKVIPEFVEAERVFNDPNVTFGYFIVYTPVR